ncbi:MAG: hypothetical protein AAFX04_01150 [Pseudomonadota bacterium]
MKIVHMAVVLAGASMLGGCLAAEIVTAPIDAVTTTQSEADEDRGRAMRERDEKLGSLERRRKDALKDCDKGRRSRCEDADKLEREIAELQAAPLDY